MGINIAFVLKINSISSRNKKQMKYLILIFCTIMATGSSAQLCKTLYLKQLESGSKLVECKHNYTIEKLRKDHYIFKRYYPENKTITHLATFKSKKLKVKHGLYQKRWDDGTLVASGNYVDDKKEGTWIEGGNRRGEYKNNLKDGLWKTYNSDTICIAKCGYVKGALHGQSIRFDTLGQIASREVYDYGNLIRNSYNKTNQGPESLPIFPGCDTTVMQGSKLKSCSDQKLLRYIYGKMKYPAEAKDLGVQGAALVSFVIDRDGSVVDIKIRNGVSWDIRKEVIRVMKEMPKWRPAFKDGKLVRVHYNLPITFALK